jgi:type IV pilus assembly protein PilQ
MLKRLIGLTLVGVFLGSVVFAQGTDFKVDKIEIKELEESVQVLITSNGPVKYKSFSLDNPPRIRLFLPQALLTWEENELIMKEGLIKKIETVQYSTKPNIIQIEIYLAYQAAFDVKADKNLLVLEVDRVISPTPRKVAREAKKRYREGKRFYQRQEFKKAIVAFREALKLDPKLSRAKNYIQKAELAMGEREREEKEKVAALKEKKIREAEEKRYAARQAAIRNYYALGKDYYKEREFIEAIVQWNKVLALDPEHEVAKDIARAEEKLQEIIEERKLKEQEAQRVRERQEELAQERSQAEEKRRLAVESQEKICSYYDQGKTYYWTGDLKRARMQFMKVLTLDPEHKKALKYKKKCEKELLDAAQKEELAKQEKEKLKQEKLAKRLQKEKEAEIAGYYELGKKYYKEGSYLEAIDVFKKILALDAGDLEAKKYLDRSQEKLNLAQAAATKKAAEERAIAIAETGKEAYSMEDIQVASIPDKTQIIISTDKEGVKYSSFSLASPPRLVVDIPNTTLTWKKKEIEVPGSVVERVRAGQFLKEPKVTRVVLDLKEEIKYAFRTEKNRIILEVENPYYVVGITDVSLKKLPEKTEVTIIAEKPVRHSAFTLLDPPVVVVDMYEAAITWPQNSITVEDGGVIKGVRAGQFEDDIARVVIDLKEMIAYRVSSIDNKIIVDIQPPAVPTVSPAAAKDEKLLSMDFKDADVHNVLRIIGQKAGLNIIAGPDLTGTVTVSFTDVTAEDALNVILRVRGFGYERTKDIIRVMRLAKELPEIETTTKIFGLNYAKASDIENMLTVSKMLSDEGRVIVDVRSNTLMIIDTPVKIAEIGRMITTLDVRPLQVAIESKLVDLSLADEEVLGVDWSWVKTTAGQTAKDSSIRLISQSGGGAFSYGTIGASDLALLIDALATRRGVNILSNPKITTLDNEKAEIKVTTGKPYYTSTDYEYEGGKWKVERTWQVKDVGVTLSVTPHIGKDDYILTEIATEVSTLEGMAGEGTDNPYPIITTRKSDNKVMIKDGDTLIIGGLIREEETASYSGVPGFSKVPVLKYLFGRKHTTKSKRELVIFVTPRIVRSD